MDPVKTFDCYHLLDCLLDVASVTICVWHSRILLVFSSMFSDPNSCPMIMPGVWNPTIYFIKLYFDKKASIQTRFTKPSDLRFALQVLKIGGSFFPKETI